MLVISMGGEEEKNLNWWIGFGFFVCGYVLMAFIVHVYNGTKNWAIFSLGTFIIVGFIVCREMGLFTTIVELFK